MIKTRSDIKAFIENLKKNGFFSFENKSDWVAIRYNSSKELFEVYNIKWKGSEFWRDNDLNFLDFIWANRRSINKQIKEVNNEKEEIREEIEEVGSLISDLFVIQGRAPNGFIEEEIEKIRRYLIGYRDALEKELNIMKGGTNGRSKKAGNRRV